MPAPDLPAAAVDLSDAEFHELDELLADAPEPLQPLDAVALDGYLCGVIVQPVLVAAEDWLPWVFDYEGTALPEGIDAAWRERVRALVLRRHAALNRALLDGGGFDPLILVPDEEGEGIDEVDDELVRRVSPVSRPLLPWVAGFSAACAVFGGLLDLDDEPVMSALARVFRHLPAETDEERDLLALLDRELPLATVDDAIEELVNAVADLADLTQDARYHVETVKRAAPKIGRNDPCPCGSGRKFKQCHGAG